MDDNDAIRGQLDSIILRSLLDKDEYGLEIFNNIKLLDNVMGEIKQSTFYNALKRLENASVISSYEGDISKGAKRIYYSITPNGRRYLLDEYRRWDIDSDTEIDLFDSGDDTDDNVYKKRKRTRRNKASELASYEINSAAGQKINSPSEIEVAAENKTEPEPRYTSEIKLNTIIGGKYPPKAEPQPKPEAPNTRTAAEILYSDNKAKSDAADANKIASFTLLGGTDDSKTIEEKKARLNDILSMDFGTVDDSDNSSVAAAEAESSTADTAAQYKPINAVADAPNDLAHSADYAQKSDFADFKATIIVENTQNEDAKATDDEIGNPRVEILSKPYVESLAEIKSEASENVNYIDSLADIYKKDAVVASLDDVKPDNRGVEITRINTLNYDDYDEEKFKETSLNKLKQRLALENIRLKQYVKGNTTSFYIGKYYYNNKLLRDASIITYFIFLAMCVSAHFIAGATHSADTALTIVFSLLGALYPTYACVKWYVMPAKRKRLPLNISMMFIASLLIYVLSIVIIVLVAFFYFKVNVAVPSSTIAPLVLPLVISAIVPFGVLVYALLFRSGRYNLK